MLNGLVLRLSCSIIASLKHLRVWLRNISGQPSTSLTDAEVGAVGKVLERLACQHHVHAELARLLDHLVDNVVGVVSGEHGCLVDNDELDQTVRLAALLGADLELLH